MAKNPFQSEKRSKVLGLPIGRRRRVTDWRKVGVVGAGVATTLAGGLGARMAGSRSSEGSDGQDNQDSQESHESQDSAESGSE